MTTALLEEKPVSVTPMSPAGLREASDHDPSVKSLSFLWRGAVTDEELVELTESHGGASAAGWWDQIRPHSLGWVTARATDGSLVGFAHVAWDAGDHAFLLDPKTRPDYQRRGVGTAVVRLATERAKAAGCGVLHVDFGEELRPFYFGACGFAPTTAGIIDLSNVESAT